MCGELPALASKGGLDLVVVDYLQRVTPADRRADRHLQIGQITWDLKALALELRCRALSLPVEPAGGRAGQEDGTDYRARLSHLKESGDVEQDADMVLLLHSSNGRWKLR